MKKLSKKSMKLIVKMSVLSFGCRLFKNLLGLHKEQSDVITTSNLGSYVFAKKMGPVLTRGEPINSRTISSKI